jgi:hypothetical protein
MANSCSTVRVRMSVCDDCAVSVSATERRGRMGLWRPLHNRYLCDACLAPREEKRKAAMAARACRHEARCGNCVAYCLRPGVVETPDGWRCREHRPADCCRYGSVWDGPGKWLCSAHAAPCPACGARAWDRDQSMLAVTCSCGLIVLDLAVIEAGSFAKAIASAAAMKTATSTKMNPAETPVFTNRGPAGAKTIVLPKPDGPVTIVYRDGEEYARAYAAARAAGVAPRLVDHSAASLHAWYKRAIAEVTAGRRPELAEVLTRVSPGIQKENEMGRFRRTLRRVARWAAVALLVSGLGLGAANVYETHARSAVKFFEGAGPAMTGPADALHLACGDCAQDHEGECLGTDEEAF